MYTIIYYASLKGHSLAHRERMYIMQLKRLKPVYNSLYESIHRNIHFLETSQISTQKTLIFNKVLSNIYIYIYYNIENT